QSVLFEYPEPYFWFSGLSGWSSIILWSVTIILSLILLCVAISNHYKTINKDVQDFLPPKNKTQIEQDKKPFFSTFGEWLKENWLWFIKEDDEGNDGVKDTKSESNDSQPVSNGSQPESNGSQPESKDPQPELVPISVEAIWDDLQDKMIFRVIIDLIAFIMIFYATYWWLLLEGGRINLHAPYRDAISYNLGTTTQFWAYFSLLMLVFGTTLLTRFCTNFIKRISDNLGEVKSEEKKTDEDKSKEKKPDDDKYRVKELEWSDCACCKKFEKRWNVDINEVADLVGIHFVAKFTNKASAMVLYPILPLILFCMAYSPILENHYINNYYYFILFVFAVMIFAPAYQLRREATKIKKRLLERQRGYLNYKSNLNQDDDQRKRIEQAIIDTENLQDGAFQSLLEHQFIQAILFLLGGISLPAFLGLTGQTF
ncbi:MAG: hypothetical protein LBP87_04485, partial [Planctomycetaceae bacterium]|nr:hypothetical protein [Planctomycetaceae bacterium]